MSEVALVTLSLRKEQYVKNNGRLGSRPWTRREFIDIHNTYLFILNLVIMICFTVLFIHFAIYLCLILFYEYVLSINIKNVKKQWQKICLHKWIFYACFSYFYLNILKTLKIIFKYFKTGFSTIILIMSKLPR